MNYREDFDPNSPYSYAHCSYLIVDSQDFFANFGQTEFAPSFFDPNQRFSVDNSKIFLKCNGTFDPRTLQQYQSHQGPYTFGEMSGIINTPEWTS